MASIYGVSIKNLKHFKDHEGCSICQGDIWLNGKKLGFWSQDSWGGCDHFDFDKKLLHDAVEKYKKSGLCQIEMNGFMDEEILIGDLTNIMLLEKDFKSHAKKGFNSLVSAEFLSGVDGYFSKEKTKEEIEVSKYYREFVEKCNKKSLPEYPVRFHIYTCLEDFNIQ